MVTGIVLAAGRSTRMGGGQNKQFLELHGQPILWYALSAFQQCASVDEILIVSRPENAAAARDLAGQFPKVAQIANGGAERQNSVWNGLQLARGQIVAVHDGARPLVTPQLIAATIDSARTHGTGIAASKIVDTIKEADDTRTILRTVDRTRLWAVQTPQTVQTDLLRRAYGQVLEQGIVVTDEAAAVERLGHPVRLVDTPFLNLKVTMPHDLAIAEALLHQRATAAGPVALDAARL